MSDNSCVAIAYRKERTHAKFSVRDGSKSSIAITYNQGRTRMTLKGNAHGEAAAGDTAAVDADANGAHASQAV